MTEYLTVDDVDVSGLNVLVRADLNVPLVDGEIGDEFRLTSALPTLETLVVRGARVSVCSHLGRPKGEDPALSLRPVASRLNEMSDLAIEFETGGDVTVLENTRFSEGETSNAPLFASHLSDGVDLFVQDAFGSVHRAHASTVGVAERVRSVAGPLVVRELQQLGSLLVNPPRPYVVVLGGAKVSDKLGVLRNLAPKVDHLLLGGGMCFTFLQAFGHKVGDSLLEESMNAQVRDLLDRYREVINLPSDFVVGDRFSPDARFETTTSADIPSGSIGLDIGPNTATEFAAIIEGAGSLFWNGPMGVFEWDATRRGTEAVARAVASCSGFSAVGGGDSAAALRMLGLERAVDHLSTGGGASLELLEGKELPGIAVLERWVR